MQCLVIALTSSVTTMSLLTYLMNSFSIVVGSKSSISSSSSPDVKILNHLQRCCTCKLCTCNSLLDKFHVPNKNSKTAAILVFVSRSGGFYCESKKDKSFLVCEKQFCGCYTTCTRAVWIWFARQPCSETWHTQNGSAGVNVPGSYVVQPTMRSTLYVYDSCSPLTR